MTETANTYTLPCGLRVIHVPASNDVGYCGVSIDAGTRDELPSEFGMAHFCEHMMFKGTTHRRASHILKRMESVGGDLNAYTNKEETVVYSTFMREHLWRAVELILDIVFNSIFPQQEIDKECEVIVDEIESYNDSPSDLVFDRFENVIFEGRDLAHDILGTAESVRSFRTADALAFTRRLYTPERMVLWIMGNYDFDHIIRQLLRLTRREHLALLATAEVTPPLVLDGEEDRQKLNVEGTPLERVAGGEHVIDQGTHQAHVMMGRAAYGSHDDRRIALYFLNNIIGGPGMNSRLNLALRERRGLVYTVESTLTNYTDTSTWGIYFGCDIHDVNHCCRLVRHELEKMSETQLTEAQMQAAMRQIHGQIVVACDNHENYILDTAKSFLHYNRFEGMNDTFAHLERLTPELLQQVAREVFTADSLTTMIIK